MISDEALQAMSEDFDRLTKQLEASEFKRKLLQDQATDLKQRLGDLFTSQYETLQEVKKRLLRVEEEGEACRMWMSDAEKRLGMLEEAVNRWNQFAQGQAKYGDAALTGRRSTPPEEGT